MLDLSDAECLSCASVEWPAREFSEKGIDFVEKLANDARICKRCGADSTDGAARCARCGGPVATARTMRVLGWMLIGLGSFLFLFMGAITYYVAQLMYHTDTTGTGARFNGTHEQALYIFGLFGLVMLFGVSAIATGAWQAIYARPNRKLMLIILALGVLFVIVGTATRFMNH